MIRRLMISFASAMLIAAPVAAQEAPGADVVDTAAGAGSFSTLLAAAEAAGLVDTLKGEGPYTVFAPTDDAFAELPQGTVDDLLMEENRDQLTSILTYHVVAGEVMASDLEDGMEIETVEGLTLMVSTGDAVMINDATVVQPDVDASNGVIHVIDSVLMPGM